MGDEADAMDAWEMSDMGAEHGTYVYRVKRQPPTETVRYFPKRKHTHPTSPKRSKP